MFSDEELKELSTIIKNLEDIHESVEMDKRDRDFAINDLEEDLESLRKFVNKLKFMGVEE